MNFAAQKLYFFLPGAVPPGEAKWVVGHVTTYEKDQGGVVGGGVASDAKRN